MNKELLQQAQQPEALRLANWHDSMAKEPKRNQAKREKHSSTAAELRRLHVENEALRAELAKPEQPAQEPLTDKIISKLWSDAHNDTSDRMAFQVLVRLVEAAHGIGGKA